MGVEIIIVIVVALAVGAAISYFFFRQDDDHVRINVLMPPSYLGVEESWRNGGDDVLSYDATNKVLTIVSKSDPHTNLDSCAWTISEEPIGANLWQVVYNIQGGSKYYLARSVAGQPVIVNNIANTLCTWSLIGPSSTPDPVVMFSNPTVDPANPQLMSLSCAVGARIPTLTPFGPGLTDSVWRVVPFP